MTPEDLFCQALVVVSPTLKGRKMSSKELKKRRSSPRSLSFEEAIQVWPRYWSGEYQDRIAASFDVNPGRVSEVIKERKHLGSREAALALR